MDNGPSICPVVHPSIESSAKEFKFHPRSFNGKQEVNYIVHLVGGSTKKLLPAWMILLTLIISTSIDFLMQDINFT